MIRAGEFDAAIGDRTQALPHPRFSVYRNNVVAALITALEVRYPVTAQLVGGEFFAAMACEFADRHRPASPVLIGYGGDFPDFIAGFAAAASVPYLADVARLESLWWRAYHAADAEPVGPDRLAGVAPEAWEQISLVLHPSVGLLSSRHAVASIWEAHHGGRPMAEVDTGQSERVLVARPFAHVEVRRLAPEAHEFLEQLLAGAVLADAVERMAERHAEFDLTFHLGAVARLDIITGLTPS